MSNSSPIPKLSSNAKAFVPKQSSSTFPVTLNQKAKEFKPKPKAEPIIYPPILPIPNIAPSYYQAIPPYFNPNLIPLSSPVFNPIPQPQEDPAIVKAMFQHDKEEIKPQYNEEQKHWQESGKTNYVLKKKDSPEEQVIKNTEEEKLSEKKEVEKVPIEEKFKEEEGNIQKEQKTESIINFWNFI